MSGFVAPFVDLQHLRQWIGRESVQTDLVSEDLARKYHATFNHQGMAPRQGEIVPRLGHFCLAQPVAPTAGLGADGHPPLGRFLPPVPLPRRMWAGGAINFHGDLRVGDTVRRTSRIQDIMLKDGSSGCLCFVTVTHQIEANGVVVVEDRQDIVYRGPAAPNGVAKTPLPAERGVHWRKMKAESPLLFRYSALTFNTHRIHYDRRYAMEAEGYPGLVIHGPMQAALLCDYAAEVRGAPPRRFSFRSLSPLYDHDTFTLNARESGSALTLWTAREGGPISMKAEASW